MKKKKYNTQEQNIWFSADEHYSHRNIVEPWHMNRPFDSIEEMNAVLIENNNKVVKPKDIVFHLGDFAFLKTPSLVYTEIINNLNGIHYFIQGSHDRWLKNAPQILEILVNGHHIVLCHYSMRVWPRSHYNSWHLFGHSHGGLSSSDETVLKSFGKSFDVGVDSFNYFPVSFEYVSEIMKKLPDNFNLVRKEK